MNHVISLLARIPVWYSNLITKNTEVMSPLNSVLNNTVEIVSINEPKIDLVMTASSRISPSCS